MFQMTEERTSNGDLAQMPDRPIDEIVVDADRAGGNRKELQHLRRRVPTIAKGRNKEWQAEEDDRTANDQNQIGSKGASSAVPS